MNALLLHLDGDLPNLALMRIAAHHRSLGDTVTLRQTRSIEELEPRFGDGVWDRVYASAIAGCESGPGARPCDVAWLRSLRDQCVAAGVPYFLKQARLDHDIDGEGITEGAGSHSKGARSINGRTIIELPYLDGVQHAAFPEAHRG